MGLKFAPDGSLRDPERAIEELEKRIQGKPLSQGLRDAIACAEYAAWLPDSIRPIGRDKRAAILRPLFRLMVEEARDDVFSLFVGCLQRAYQEIMRFLDQGDGFRVILWPLPQDAKGNRGHESLSRYVAGNHLAELLVEELGWGATEARYYAASRIRNERLRQGKDDKLESILKGILRAYLRRLGRRSEKS